MNKIYLPMQIEKPFEVYKTHTDIVKIINKIENQLSNLLITFYNSCQPTKELINNINYLFDTAFHYLDYCLEHPGYNLNTGSRINSIKYKYQNYLKKLNTKK